MPETIVKAREAGTVAPNLRDYDAACRVFARVCSAEVPMPYAKHPEDAALPRVDTIVATARAMLAGDG